MKFWQQHGQEGWDNLLSIIHDSPWLGGKNNDNFKACFGWVLNPINTEKILNGAYKKFEPADYQSHAKNFPPEHPNSTDEWEFDDSLGRKVCLKLDTKTLQRFDPTGREWKFAQGRYWKMAADCTLGSPVLTPERGFGLNPYATLNF